MIIVKVCCLAIVARKVDSRGVPDLATSRGHQNTNLTRLQAIADAGAKTIGGNALIVQKIGTEQVTLQVPWKRYAIDRCRNRWGEGAY